jgi:hypothetical protein
MRTRIAWALPVLAAQAMAAGCRRVRPGNVYVNSWQH